MDLTLITTVVIAVLTASSAQSVAQSQSSRLAPKQQIQRQLSLGSSVPRAQRISMDTTNHSSFNSLLARYVDASGGVNYAGLKASAADSQALDAYINHLSTASTKIPAARENQMAFWINAYNAVTLKGILQEYPTTSIRNFTSETGGYNVWKHLRLVVGEAQYSLEDIEHKVLRPMGDPRIHFAVVCASKGCPRLLNEAFVGAKLNDQLNKNEVHFFSLPQNFQYDQARRQFKMSTIMKWYGSDFGADQATQLRAIAPYLPTREAQAAANANAVSISYLDYSWQLNEQPKAMAGSGTKPMSGSGTQQGSQAQRGSGTSAPAAGSGRR